MAMAIFPRLLNNELLKASTVSPGFTKFVKIQYANISSKENRDPNIKKPPPFPYQTKKLSYFRCFYDFPTKRFDENSKIIIVDGNIGAGKSALAKELADVFDMVYFPEPTMERYFVSAYGIDLRKIDPILPPSYKCCDLSTFYANPHHQNVPKFQFRMFMFRLEQYIDALAHVLNTGQGVVLERSVYGDFVFVEAMHKFGYLKSDALQLYNDIKKNCLEELMRPHLIIYLDVPADVALERIKKRNDPIEVNSKVLTKEYLETIEHIYKYQYLKEMEKYTELLIYDWSSYGDTEVVVEDIERIDFEKYTRYDYKLKDWRKYDEWEWNISRRYYTNDKSKIMMYGYIFRPAVEELYHPREEVVQLQELMEKVPGEKYAEGYNPLAGDNVWLKTRAEKGHRHMPLARLPPE